MNSQNYKRSIIKYYRQSGWLYKYFWYSNKSLALHCGFWNKETKNIDQALINQYKHVIEKAKIKKGMRILDAGCGVGGGSIYIAQQTGAKVTGITISPEQVKEARLNVVKNEVGKLVNIELMDFEKTIFPDSFFDVIFGIESVCYAHPKTTFLKEVYRILKPGGVLIINDGYIKRVPSGSEENKLFEAMCRGWKVYEFVDYRKMTETMKATNFRDIVVEDMAVAVRPTLRKIGVLVKWFKPVIKLTQGIRSDAAQSVRDNVESLATLDEGDRIGLFGYYSHIAKK